MLITPVPNAIAALDAADPLRAMRERFILPADTIYLDGNSLGPATHASLAVLETASREEWAQGLIRSWHTAGWVSLSEQLGARIARLIGAGEDEVVVCDSTSVNLYKVLHAACALRPGRTIIVAEAGSFPTDLYIAEGLLSTRPYLQLRLEGRDGERLEDLIDSNTAVVLVNHVDYRTGRLRDMAALTRLSHEHGALAVWDLSHSAGALPVALNVADADFAVGCSYKYLNGGPGAPAYVFAARRHHATVQQPLSGWWGHARPFAFETGYAPEAGVRRFTAGTPSVLAMRALEGALSVWDAVDMAQLRAKSQALSALFIAEVEAACAGLELTLASPRAAAQRGSQVSFAHPQAYPVMQALIACGVIGDFRAPNLLRFGFTPLYIGYADVWRAAQILAEVLRSERWREPRFAQRAAVP